MPRIRARTKSQAAKKTAENGFPDGSADEEMDIPPAKTAPKLSNKKSKTPRGGKQTQATSPFPTPQPRHNEEVEKVPGARMSSTKHSGLLARDEVLRMMRGEEDEEESSLLSARRLVSGPTPMSVGNSDEEGEGEQSGEVTGREIFTIQNRRRSARTPRMNQPSSRAQPVTPGTVVEEEGGEDDEEEEGEEEDEEGEEEVGEEEGGEGEGEEEEGEEEEEGFGEAGQQQQTSKGNRSGRKTSGRQAKQETLQTGRRNVKKGHPVERVSESEIDEELDESISGGRREKGGRKDTQRDTPQASKGKGRARNVHWRSDSDQEDSEASEEEDEEEMAAVAAQLNRGGGVGEEALDDYFTAHTGTAGPTSDHTLSQLARPRLEQAAIQTALQDVPTLFQSDCQQLLGEYAQLYSYWLLQMKSGYNILLYGLGSKKQLIEDFCKRCLSRSCHLVVNGFFPGLTLKQILNSLSSNLLGHNSAFKSHTEHAQFITNTLEKQNHPSDKNTTSELFLVIHNLDGPMLRSERAQAALSVLASSNHIHVVASVDHINSSLLWDQTKLSRFRWAWHDITTFQTYREETSYENSLLVQQSGSLALSSLTHVMKSLTPNACKIFELLAKNQLESKREGERSYQGLSFSECYRRCREDFLVNSDLTLRAQLTEFIDHKLVRLAKGNDGVEYLSIPVDDATLSQFLSEFND